METSKSQSLKSNAAEVHKPPKKRDMKRKDKMETKLWSPKRARALRNTIVAAGAGDCFNCK